MGAPSAMELALQARKGDLATSYIEGGTYGRGQLPPEVAEEFISLVRLEDDFTNDIGVGTMMNPIEYTDLIGFGSRVTRLDVVGTAMTEDERSSPTITRNVLTAVWFRAGFDLEYHIQHETIAREGLGNVVQREFLSQVGYDLAEQCISGDTSSSTSGLNGFDGFLVQAEDGSRMIDESSSPLSVNDDLFHNIYQSFGAKYRRGKWRPRLAFLCSDATESAYHHWLTNNRNIATASLFDNQDPGKRIKFQGIPIKPYQAWPNNYIMLTSLDNLVIKMFIRMFLEQQRFIDEGIDKFRLRYAADCGFIETDGVVLHKGVSTGVTASL